MGLEAAILQRKRNSSLVKFFCAKNLSGLKSDTEGENLQFLLGVVGECSDCIEALVVRQGGAIRSKNAGISSKTRDEKSLRRKSKVSSATRIVGRLGGPKVNPRGLTDGQPVNIPAPPYKSKGGTLFQVLSSFWL